MSATKTRGNGPEIILSAALLYNINAKLLFDVVSRVQSSSHTLFPWSVKLTDPKPSAS